jgi:hypothetical protein
LLIERFFAEITSKRIRRGIFKSVADLVAAIEDGSSAAPIAPQSTLPAIFGGFYIANPKSQGAHRRRTFMSDPNVSCPKCKTRMEAGFVLDRGPLNIPTPNVPTWVDGPWVPSTVTEKLFGNSLRDKRQRSITSYRCTSCGYLESYAR